MGPFLIYRIILITPRVEHSDQKRISLTKLLIPTFVTNRLHYCNPVLYGALDYVIKQFQRLLKRAAGLLFALGNSVVNSLLNELHWLHIEKE